MPTETSPIDALPFDVTYRSGPKKGQTERIAYLELDLVEIYTWAELTKERNTPKLLALGTGRDLAWVRTLSFKSAADLAKRIFDLNFTNALTLMQDPVMASLLNWLLQESADAIAKMTPEQLKALEQEVEKKRQADGKPGTSSSITPPPSVSAAAITSVSSASLPADSAISSPLESASSPATG